MEIMNIKIKRNGDYEIVNPYDEKEKVTIEAKYAELFCEGIYNSLNPELAASILGTFEILRKQACCIKYHDPVSFRTGEGIDMAIQIINHYGFEVIGDIETYQDIENLFKSTIKY